MPLRLAPQQARWFKARRTRSVRKEHCGPTRCPANRLSYTEAAAYTRRRLTRCLASGGSSLMPRASWQNMWHAVSDVIMALCCRQRRRCGQGTQGRHNHSNASTEDTEQAAQGMIFAAQPRGSPCPGRGRGPGSSPAAARRGHAAPASAATAGPTRRLRDWPPETPRR